MNSGSLQKLNNNIQWFSWCLDSEQDINLDYARQLLSEEELAKALRFNFKIHKDRYIRGRGYLRKILHEILNESPTSLQILKNKFDKPYLLNNPLYFNMSHSEGTAVLAISHEKPIGIDLEFISEKIDHNELSNMVYIEHELDYLDKFMAEEQKKLFFNFWTAKEAYLKFLGTGLSLEPTKVSLELKDGLPVSAKAEGYNLSKLTYLELDEENTVCCVAY